MSKVSGIKGGARLRSTLRRLPVAILGEVRGAVAASAQAVYDEARVRMPTPGTHPYATGELQRKFRLFVSKDGLRARIGSWGKRRARHIHLVEFGAAPHAIPMPDGGTVQHPGAPAQPFLFPAYKAKARGARLTIRAAVRKALDREARR